MITHIQQVRIYRMYKTTLEFARMYKTTRVLYKTTSAYVQNDKGLVQNDKRSCTKRQTKEIL